jgi:hypothetical protein
MPMDGRIIVTMELLQNMQEGYGYFLLMCTLKSFARFEQLRIISENLYVKS